MLVELQGGEYNYEKGDKIIKLFSKKLTEDLEEEVTINQLKYIRLFYLIFSREEFKDMHINISWSYYKVLLKLKDAKKIKYYLNQIVNEKISKRELIRRVKNKHYENNYVFEED